jgi:hypothetical protein
VDELLRAIDAAYSTTTAEAAMPPAAAGVVVVVVAAVAAAAVAETGSSTAVPSSAPLPAPRAAAAPAAATLAAVGRAAGCELGGLPVVDVPAVCREAARVHAAAADAWRERQRRLAQAALAAAAAAADVDKGASAPLVAPLGGVAHTSLTTKASGGTGAAQPALLQARLGPPTGPAPPTQLEAVLAHMRRPDSGCSRGAVLLGLEHCQAQAAVVDGAGAHSTLLPPPWAMEAAASSVPAS